jgi:iron complex outermembrane receptor protein
LHLQQHFITFAIVLQKTIIILIMLCWPIVMKAQQTSTISCNYVLKGIIIDEHDTSPLDYSSVFIPELNKGFVTDSLGNFIINGICPGTYTFRLSHVGCDERDTVLNLQLPYPFLQLVLEHHAEELLETVIISKVLIRNSVSEVSSQVKNKELKDPTADLGKLLSTITGVTNLQTGPTIFKPVIQGMHSDRVLIVNNGVRLESQSWGAEHAPEIDASSAQQLSVVKGAGSIQYGTDAMGGVIIFQNENIDFSGKLKGVFKSGFNSNNLGTGFHGQLEQGYILKNKQQIAWHVNGTFRKAADASAPKYVLSNTAMDEYAGQATLQWKIPGKIPLTFLSRYSYYNRNMGILSASHIGNLEDLNVALESIRPTIINPKSFNINNPKQSVRHQTISNRISFKIKRHNINLQYDFQTDMRQEFDIRRGNRSNTPALDLQLNAHHIGTQYLSVKNIWTTKAGVDYYYRYNKNVPGTGIRPIIPDYVNNAIAIWLFQAVELEKITFEVGLRYEHHSYDVFKFDNNNKLTKPSYQFNNAAALLGFKWKINDLITWNSSLGISSRSPNVNELFSEGLHQSAAAIEYGDSTLVPERGFKWSQNIAFRWNQLISIDVTPFANYISNYIYLNPLNEPVLTIRGAFPAFDYRQTDVFFGGIDADITVHPSIKWMKLFAKYSYIRIVKINDGQELINTPPNRITIGSGVETFQWKGFQNLYFDIEIAYVAEQFRVNPNLDYSAPPKGYALLNVSAGSEKALKNGNRLGFGVSVNNALNTTYRDYLDRFRYFADAPGININGRLYFIL